MNKRDEMQGDAFDFRPETMGIHYGEGIKIIINAFARIFYEGFLGGPYLKEIIGMLFQPQHLEGMEMPLGNGCGVHLLVKLQINSYRVIIHDAYPVISAV